MEKILAKLQEMEAHQEAVMQWEARAQELMAPQSSSWLGFSLKTPLREGFVLSCDLLDSTRKAAQDILVLASRVGAQSELWAAVVSALRTIANQRINVFSTTHSLHVLGSQWYAQSKTVDELARLPALVSEVYERAVHVHATRHGFDANVNDIVREAETKIQSTQNSLRDQVKEYD